MDRIDAYRTDANLQPWANREEQQTIESLFPGALSENLLRREHGITTRTGHGGITRDEWEQT